MYVNMLAYICLQIKQICVYVLYNNKGRTGAQFHGQPAWFPVCLPPPSPAAVNSHNSTRRSSIWRPSVHTSRSITAKKLRSRDKQSACQPYTRTGIWPVNTPVVCAVVRSTLSAVRPPAGSTTQNQLRPTLLSSICPLAFAPYRI